MLERARRSGGLGGDMSSVASPSGRPSTAREVTLSTTTRLRLSLGTAAAKPSKRGLEDQRVDDTGLLIATTATRDQINKAIDAANSFESKREKSIEEKHLVETQQRALYRVTTLMTKGAAPNAGADEMDINLNKANEVLRMVEDKSEFIDDLVIDLTHEEVEEKHASNLGFVKLERGGVITKKDMQQYKRMYHEIESFSRRGTITLPAFRRYLAASCPGLVHETDRVTNTSMYHKLTRGNKDHFSLIDFMLFMYPKATRREIELACSMVGERIDRPHVQIEAAIIREIAEIFKFWNLSGTGEMVWEELRGHLVTMMSPLQVEELLADAKHYDDDGSQGLCFREFMFWWTAGGTEVDMTSLQDQRKQFQKARDPVHVLNSYIESHSRGSSFKEMHDTEDVRQMEHVRKYLALKAAEEEAEREKEREKERAKLRELERRQRLKEELARETERMEAHAAEMAAQGLLPPEGSPSAAQGGSGAFSIEARLRMLLAKSDPVGDTSNILSVMGNLAIRASSGMPAPPAGVAIDEPTPSGIERADPRTTSIKDLRGVMQRNSFRMAKEASGQSFSVSSSTLDEKTIEMAAEQQQSQLGGGVMRQGSSKALLNSAGFAGGKKTFIARTPSVLGRTTSSLGRATSARASSGRAGMGPPNQMGTGIGSIPEEMGPRTHSRRPSFMSSTSSRTGF